MYRPGRKEQQISIRFMIESLGVFDFNEAAIRCYEKVGFTREGLKRDARKYKDTYWNLIEMSILDDECRRINL